MTGPLVVATSELLSHLSCRNKKRSMTFFPSNVLILFHPSLLPLPLLSPSLPLSYVLFLPTTAISPHSLTTLVGVIVVFERTHTVHSIVDLTHHAEGPHVSTSVTTEHRLSLASGGVIEMDGPVVNVQTYLYSDNYLNVT